MGIIGDFSLFIGLAFAIPMMLKIVSCGEIAFEVTVGATVTPSVFNFQNATTSF